jgi:hypothetical protein
MPPFIFIFFVTDSFFRDELENLPKRCRFYLILDCCHSGRFNIGPKGVVFAACQGVEESICGFIDEANGYGSMFTESLLNIMDRHRGLNLTNGQMFERVKQLVVETDNNDFEEGMAMLEDEDDEEELVVEEEEEEMLEEEEAEMLAEEEAEMFEEEEFSDEEENFNEEEEEFLDEEEEKVLEVFEEEEQLETNHVPVLRHHYHQAREIFLK